MHTVVVHLIANQMIEIPGKKGSKEVNVHDIRSIKVHGHRIVNVFLEPKVSEEARELGFVKDDWIFGDDEEVE